MAELKINEALRLGIDAQKSGKINKAEEYYSAILRVQPNHPDTNHNMGVLAVSVGKTEAALPFFKKALEARPSTAQFWFSLIDNLIKLKKFGDAKAILDQAKQKGAKGEIFDTLERKIIPNIEAKNNEGIDQKLISELIALYQSGQFEETYSKVTKLLKYNHNIPILIELSALANLSLKRYTSAINEFKKLLKYKPNSAEIYNNIGIASKAVGNLNAAIENYKTAINIMPNFAEAYYNIANCYKEMSDFTAAQENYMSAIKLKPNFAEVYNNLGTIFRENNEYIKAIENYEKALEFKPSFAEAYNNLGTIYKENNEYSNALQNYKKALKLNPKYTDCYINLGIVLKYAFAEEPDPELYSIIDKLLHLKGLVRPGTIAKPILLLLKLDPKIKNILETRKSISNTSEFEDIISTLSEFNLLKTLMKRSTIPELEFEELFSNLRKFLLENLDNLSLKDHDITFIESLALQCLINEHVYYESENERLLVSELVKKLEGLAEANIQPSIIQIMCLSTYRPLLEFEWSDKLILDKPFHSFITTTISEPKEEQKIAQSIAKIGKINNEISLKVQKQYEQNPYPRWIDIGLRTEPSEVREVVEEIELNLTSNKINTIMSPSILIAGCGTGQHSIGSAARFKNSTITAIDLSLASLAYAKRKTDEIGQKNIKYLQADILDLKNLPDMFDIIESVGVLHHMASPMDGWRILKSKLLPGGLMFVGLYSDLARSDVSKARKFLNVSKTRMNKKNIRKLRGRIISSKSPTIMEICKRADFYSLSEVRDLLFHVSESTFTISSISDALDDLGLIFCGFENKQVCENFKTIYNSKFDLYDLKKWAKFEKSYPKSFTSMYQFWCQKPF